MPRRQLKGTVVSNRMQKTVVVRVESVKKYPKYKKTIKSHKKYKAHVESPFEVGDKVIIEERRPLSKEKRWEVIKKL